MLIAIAFSSSVSAKAPPGHGAAKEPKTNECPIFAYASATELAYTGSAIAVMYSDVICYVEPVRNWQYVDLMPSLYTTPHVEKPQAFYARNSC